MKVLKYISILLLFVFLISCGKPVAIEETFKSEFDAPFPKKSTKNLRQIFGDSVLVKHNGDTVVYFFGFNGKENYIIERGKFTIQYGEGPKYDSTIVETYQDTIFKGVVCKYKGNYILTRARNDSTYMIYMIKIKRNLIYGLNNLTSQVEMFDQCIDQSSFNIDKMLIKRDSITYRMHPDKKILGEYFKMLLDSGIVYPDTILTAISFKSINALDENDSESNEVPADKSVVGFSYKLYPNPVLDVLNVDLSECSRVEYRILDLKGQVHNNGILSSTSNQIQVGTLLPGAYIFTFTNPQTKKVEKIKLIKK